jgi:hypothetical protein
MAETYQFIGYHATPTGIGKKVINEGFKLMPGSTNLFGRGIYFWEMEKDAKSLAEKWFPEGADIIRAEWTEPEHAIRVYDPAKRSNLTANELSRNLLNIGVRTLIIPNHLMEAATMPTAIGYAYVQLRDPGQEFNFFQHIRDWKNI